MTASLDGQLNGALSDLNWVAEDACDEANLAVRVMRLAQRNGIVLPEDGVADIVRHLEKAFERFEAAHRDISAALGRFYDIEQEQRHDTANKYPTTKPH